MPALENSPRITPFLWFDSNAEEAVHFYLTVFKNSRRLDELRTVVDMPRPDGSIVPAGSILTIAFSLDGQHFTALNGGPFHKFTEAVSFVIRCDSQTEIDDYWAKLTADGGAEIQCGWLRDKFGLAWQIVPAQIAERLKNPKAFHALMQMKKIILADLESASTESAAKS
jgi:predicted 3-demethylubiquinone-9 3-methyltransferase (glyoxalase superfamily)